MRDELSNENHGLDSSSQVFIYENDFYPLSSFASFRLHYDGIDFDTLEHAYHYQKFHSYPDIQRKIVNARSAHDAFKIAQAYKSKQRADWVDVRVPVMEKLDIAKATQHEYVYRKLIQTLGREIIENSWRDSFWGWGADRKGLNMKGKCLEAARSYVLEVPPKFGEVIFEHVPLPKGYKVIHDRRFSDLCVSPHSGKVTTREGGYYPSFVVQCPNAIRHPLSDETIKQCRESLRVFGDDDQYDEGKINFVMHF